MTFDLGTQLDRPGRPKLAVALCDGDSNAGLKQFAHVEVRRQMGVNTTASVATSYHPHAGMGFVLATSRTLTDTLDADLTYQVGPESVMSFGLTRRGENNYTSGRIEVLHLLSLLTSNTASLLSHLCLADPPVKTTRGV